MVKASTDPVERQQHYSATLSGALRGGSIGLGTGLAGSFAAQRAGIRAYSALTLPLKAFFVCGATTAGFIIGADSAARQFELSKYAIGSGTALSREAHANEQLERAAGIGGRTALAHQEVSTSDMLIDWAREHRYSCVFGAWAASMVGSWGYISLTPLSFAQKIVQARMVAQGLTVAVLVASAGLASIPTAGTGGLNEEEVKRREREETMYRWKKGSPHDLAHQQQGQK